MVSKPVNVVREEGVNFYIDQGIAENDRMVMTLPEYPQNGMAVKIVGEASPLVAKTKQADDSNSSEAQ
jgi:hypothetical protein